MNTPPANKPYKLDERILLQYCCSLLRTNPQRLRAELSRLLQLDNATLVNKTTTTTTKKNSDEPNKYCIQVELLYSTSTALIKTTKHKRVKNYVLRKGNK